MAIGSASLFFSSCKGKSFEGMIILTQVIGNELNTNNTTEDSWRYIPQTRIVAIDSANPDESIKVLTEDYFSARSPEISSDGNFLLFTAQKKQNDPWQIWEMNLSDLKTRHITTSPDNCFDPAYLPGERIVFSRINPNDSLKADHSLFTCNLNGTNLKRITFNNNNYFAPVVLKDGRVLTISRKIHHGRVDQQYMVLRPDGTKEELFYRGSDGSALNSRGLETANGKIVFIESANFTVGGGNIISINYNRPLHTRVNLTSELNGKFSSVYPMKSGKLLVSYRPSQTGRSALYEFDPEKMTLGNTLYNSKEYDALDAIIVEKRERPKKLPSEVDMGVKTGLILCQNINISDQKSSSNATASPKTSRIEVIGTDSTLGEVQVEDDGSFYLKVIADTPFKIQTLDKDGNVIQGCDWIWLRPNERRGCVGCHEDPEMVPDNRVPLSVKKLPAVLPMHINKVVEKKVSLE
jgi:Hydrazine synthase alpha subunit middle domain/WD40-like Beta Propeller Repeat